MESYHLNHKFNSNKAVFTIRKDFIRLIIITITIKKYKAKQNFIKNMIIIAMNRAIIVEIMIIKIIIATIKTYYFNNYLKNSKFEKNNI